jgi:tyrosine aminotransferase
LGDPTVFGNLPPCPAAIEAITETLKMGGAMATGYVNACGTPEARAAIAERHGASATADNVIVASGCSGALELALTALLDADSILLVPSPGFPLYSVIAKSHGAKVEHYDLLPDSGWECDLVQMDQLITRLNNIDGHNRSMQENTCGSRPPTKVVRGIVVNNPGNPTGSVYSAHHLRNILKLAHKHRIPIVADEIYGDLVFDPNRCFFPMAEISAQMGRYVPVITASGLGKQYLVPGWRVGWVIFHDKCVFLFSIEFISSSIIGGLCFLYSLSAFMFLLRI